MHIHVLRGLWMLVKLAVDFAKIPHVDATLMEEFGQALRVNRDTFLLLELIDHVRNGFFIDVSCKLLDVVFFLFQFSLSHVQLSILFEDVRVERDLWSILDQPFDLFELLDVVFLPA